MHSFSRASTGHHGVNPAIIRGRDEWDEGVAFDAMCELGEDWWAWMIENLHRGEDRQVKARLREMEMTRIAAQVNRCEQRMHPVLGEPEYKVSRDIMHDWAWKFRDQNDRADYTCWEDDEFIRDMKRDNPEMRVNIAKAGNRVGWTRAMDSTATVVLTDKRGMAAENDEDRIPKSEGMTKRRPLPRTSLPSSGPRRPKTQNPNA